MTGKSEGLRFGPDQQGLRWSQFKNAEPAVMFTTVADKVFPFLRDLGGDGSTYSEHMRDARFTIPTPALLSKVVDMLDDIPMADRDTNGDLYEVPAVQDCRRRGERAVPHAPPHHRTDGQDDGAQAHRRDLRSGVWNWRIPGGGVGVCARRTFIGAD